MGESGAAGAPVLPAPARRDVAIVDAVITHATVAENEQKDQLLERDFPLAKGGQVEAVLDVREEGVYSEIVPFQKAEADRWWPIIKAAGIKAD